MPPPDTPPADLPDFDPAAAAERLGGQADFLRQVVERFAASAPALLAQAGGACPADPALLRRSLHTLAGSSATCGGSRTAAQAEALTRLAAAGRLDEVAAGLPSLEAALHALLAQATAWAREPH